MAEVSQKKIPSKVMAGLLVLCVFILIIAYRASRTADEMESAFAKPAPSQSEPVKPQTEREIFYGAAFSYLKTANEQQGRIARAMAGASNGSSTLTEIKQAINAAVRVENAGYFGDYKGKFANPFDADFAAELATIHKRFQAATEELLEFYKDNQSAHIESGAAALKKCMEMAHTAITSLTAKIKS